jgi:putative oxidoreductase
MSDLGLLTLRLTLGGLLAAHGSQKLFGSFDGGGPEGTGEFMEQVGLQPGQQWAITAGLGEFVGGLLTCLGFMSPLGPITSLGPMAVAWGRVHWGKPIWVTSGGGELPLTNLGIAVALTLTGPGRVSLDRLFGIRVPAALSLLVAGGVAAGVVTALSQPQPAPRRQPTPQRTAEPEPAQTL